MNKMVKLGGTALVLLLLAPQMVIATNDCQQTIPSGVIYQLEKSKEDPFTFRGHYYKLVSPSWEVLKKEFFDEDKFEKYKLNDMRLSSASEKGCTYELQPKSTFIVKPIELTFDESKPE